MSFEESFEEAVQNGSIPGAVMFARNSKGMEFSKVFGYGDLTSKEPLQLDSVLSIASCTKLMTSIAAVQCVERGLIGLDDDVASLVPKLTNLEVITGFEDEKPVLEKRQNPITLRLLLTHSAGVAYESGHPLTRQWRETQDLDAGDHVTIEGSFVSPMIYQPGKSWLYGPAIDWAGRVVETLTKKSLEEYCQENIWGPLGMSSTTFTPYLTDSMKAKQMSMTARNSNGDGKVVSYSGPYLTDAMVDCFGGSGAYATMSDYIMVLQSLLLNDEKLLEKRSIDLFFEPQLTPESQEDLNKLMRGELHSGYRAMFVGEFKDSIKVDWSLGGILTMEDDAGWRKKHSLIWSGFPNCFWFIDRTTGVCGCFGTQIIPPGDRTVGKLISLFEKEVYAKLSVATSESKI